MSSLSQQQLEQQAPRVVNIFEDKGKLFLKTFLINSAVNRAKWRINPDYISKHINKFVGRPFVLTADRSHPPEFSDGALVDPNDLPASISRLLNAQEKYRIGTIRKVEPVGAGTYSIAQARNIPDTWAAYVEVTDPTAVSAFKAGHIPKYVSPTVFRLHPQEPPDSTTDYEPMHLAAVDYPAYGVHVAGVRGACEGDLVTCSTQLAQASVLAMNDDLLRSTGAILDANDCGFCIREALEGFTNVYSSLVTNPVNQASVNLSVNSTNNAEQQPTQQPQPQQPTAAPANQPAATTVEVPTTPVQARPEGAPFEVPKKVEAAKVEEVKPAPGNLPGQVGSSNNESNSNKSKDEVATLRATVEALLSQVNELKSFRENSEKTEAEKKIAAKRGKIESFIPENYAHSKEERVKAVEYLMRFDDGPELDYIMQKFVSPVTMKEQQAKEAIKQGSISNITTRAAGKRLTDYAAAAPTTAPNNNNNDNTQAVAQASNFDMKRFQRIVSMSDIVGNSAYGGGSF